MSDHQVPRAKSQGSSQQAGTAGHQVETACPHPFLCPHGGAWRASSGSGSSREQKSSLISRWHSNPVPKPLGPLGRQEPLGPLEGSWCQPWGPGLAAVPARAAQTGLCFGAWAWEEELMAPGSYSSLGIVSEGGRTQGAPSTYLGTGPPWRLRPGCPRQAARRPAA